MKSSAPTLSPCPKSHLDAASLAQRVSQAARRLVGDPGDSFAAIPRVKGNFALGLFPQIKRQGLHGVVQTLHAAAKRAQAPAAYGWLGPQLIVLLRDPKHLFGILDANASRGGVETRGPLGVLERVLGPNLLTLTGERWRLHRSVAKDALFSDARLEEAFEVIRHVAAAHLEQVRGQATALADACMLYTMDAVSRSMLGLRDTSVETYGPAMMHAFDGVLDLLTDTRHHFAHELRNATHGQGPEALDAPEQEAQVRLFEVIRERVLKPNSAAIAADPACLLHRLCVAIGDGETYDAARLCSPDMLGATAVLLFAGHETTASILGSTLVELFRNPDVGAKLRAEVDGLPEAFSLADLNGCAYLDAVVRETLRRHAPVADAGRAATRSFALDTGSGVPLQIKKGDLLVTSPYLFHTDDVWEDGEAYRPERFTGAGLGTVGTRPQERPFGMGMHMCVGFRLAHIELKTYLAKLVRSYDIVIHNVEAAAPDLSKGTLKIGTHVQWTAQPRHP
jgi:cytochrome P450